MSTYRGKDGWVWDKDGARRIPEPTTAATPGPRADHPQVATPYTCPGCKTIYGRTVERSCPFCGRKPTPKPTPKLDKCPNCSSAAAWRAIEELCTRCGWGIPDTIKQEAREGTGVACAAIVAVVFAAPLFCAGVGYAIAGFGGLLAGGGLAILGLAALTAWALSK